jgi:hypothetical protein
LGEPARKVFMTLLSRGRRRAVASSLGSLLTAAVVLAVSTQFAFAAGPNPATTAAADAAKSAASTVRSSNYGLNKAAINHPRGVIPRVKQGQTPSSHAGVSKNSNPACPSCKPPLLFTQGSPVMGGRTGTPAGQITITPVYWAPTGHVFTSTYKSIVNGYIADVAADSQKTTNVFGVATEYYQEPLPGAQPLNYIHYVIAAGVEIDDTAAYPAQNLSPGCTAAVGYTDCIADAALQSELQAKLTALSKPIDDAHLYMVMFPSAVETCQGPGSAATGQACSSNVYCAYHSGLGVGMNAMVYGNEPYPVINGCTNPSNGVQAPNGDIFGDAELSMFSHEASESITDYNGAWFDVSGFENGDECAYVYGAPLGGVAGTLYNQVINNHHYYTQDEFSNVQFGLGIGDVNWVGGTISPSTVAGCLQRPILTGMLRVTSSPALPTQITVDGNIADSWGLNWLKVQPGSHTVCFTWVTGFSTPGCQTVTVSSSLITTVTGTFVQQGFLRVITSPAVPSAISVDGVARNEWGLWTDFPAGSHQVCYGLVKNFTPPTCQTAVITAGATTTITGTFTSSPGAPGQTNVGQLRVTSSPALPTQISVDGNVADNWGLNWLEIGPGSHAICFTWVQGYTTPACQMVTVTAGAITTVTGTFVQRGVLRVQTSPAAPGTIFINGNPSDEWGAWTDFPVGSYQVCFGQINAFANTPPCVTATLTAGATTTITGVYS